MENEKLPEGTLIGEFVVKRHLANGGMGDVYLVRDEKLAADRALKLISLTGPGFTGSKTEVQEYRQRFAREARVLARLRHPNIITVHAIGEHEGSPYLVMSYFPSFDGRRWLYKTHPELDRVRHVCLQLASALGHAHENGVIHRDIKLGNILVGKNDEAMLIDFGLAKHDTDRDLTQVGRMMGTYPYLAPEYVKELNAGTQRHTVATDMWAMGCLLYSLTCGEPPFRHENQTELLKLISRAEFEPVKRRAPGAPDEWSTIIHQLLEPDPQRRLGSAAALVAQLEALDLKQSVERPPHAARPGEDFAGAPPALAVEAPAVAAEPADPARAIPDKVTLAPKAQVGVDPPVAPRGLREAGKHAALHTHSIFDEQTGSTGAASAFPQPSFQVAEEHAPSSRASARRKLAIPLLAAGIVLGLGACLVVGVGHLGGRSARSATYVDPDELRQRQRASSELQDLAEERSRRASLHTLELTPLPEPAPSLSPAKPTPSVPEANRPLPSKPRRARAPAHEAPRVSAGDVPELNPFLARYGTRTNYNTSSGPPVSAKGVVQGDAVTASAPAAAGTRIPVRVTSAIASAPLGPVIAVVQSTTKLGATEIPRGAELHGRVTGAQGPRVLLEFSFALVNGKNVALKGIALGQDGRAGVPGAKNLGSPSDIAAGAAAGGAQALLEGAAGVVGGDIAAGAIRGATSPIVNKAGRLDNEEDLVVADAGARFVVYVESLL